MHQFNNGQPAWLGWGCGGGQEACHTKSQPECERHADTQPGGYAQSHAFADAGGWCGRCGESESLTGSWIGYHRHPQAYWPR
jgi:hypothetical protein